MVGTDVYKQVAERIDGAPVLNDYISSRVSESPEDLFFQLFFFNTSKLNMYRNASENSKAEIAGAANFSMIESLLRTTMSEEMPVKWKAPHFVAGIPTIDEWGR